MTTSKIDRGFLQQETAAFVDGLLAEGAMKGAARWRYHDMSRERNGHKDHWLVPAIADIRTLPLDAVDAMLNRLCDEREARACEDEIDLLTAQVEEQEADGEEDVAGVFAMCDPSKKHLHRDRLIRYRVKADQLIRAYNREIAAEAQSNGRKPTKASWWRNPETRKAGTNG